MIKNILLPEHIQNYYLFPKRILALSIDKTQVNGVVVIFKGKERILEKYVEEIFDSNNQTPQSERIKEVLERIKEQCGTYDQLITVLPSTSVIYKELILPLHNHDHIALVLPYEVEPSLPFALPNTAIDFIITKQNNAEKNSELLVAATPKENIENHVALLTQANMLPSIVALDMFSIYSLLLHLPELLEQHETVIVADLHMTHINLGYVTNMQLRSVRSLNGGIQSLIKMLATETNNNTGLILDNILRYGLTDNLYVNGISEEALLKTFTAFWSDVSLTINSFIQRKRNDSDKPLKCIIIESNMHIEGMAPYITHHMKLNSILFDAQTTVTQNNIVTIPKGQRLANSSIIPLSAALQLAPTEQFNLQNILNKSSSQKLFLWQIGTAFSVGILSIIVFLTYALGSTYVLQKELNANESEIIETLQQQLPTLELEPGETLEELIERAEKLIKQEETTWFAFSEQARVSFLTYLLELTNKIDKEALGFKINSITMKAKQIILKAHVRDHDALKILERDLRQSPLFSYIEPQSDTTFTMKINLKDTKE